ncbi:RNA ligase [Saccharopolyspora antimicrobica]|uniref:RNA ligase n=1 Tax=Saccharopolyspora antimicrobica TaxID=455193 RepID=A0A1I5GKX6_9PSEU|nr:RNA ligase family protein [Saccharopolyspora antimicrobica]RKT87494.1 RNA ligase [Saccharopolyspora antimicrobica]SFO36506.1 RNA ligase [Saccharopolyspora antimicrobica]
MTFDLRSTDLSALNSLTKYPSIPTYHELDPSNGGLLDSVVEYSGQVIGTEKIDGTNARIISLPDGSYLLGSREELLYAKGDLIGNPAQGIVAALQPLAETIAPVTEDVIRVHYLEVYGGKVTAASKQYTGARTVGFRIFDAVVIGDYREIMALPPQKLSEWRDSGGQPFLTESELTGLAERDDVPLAPRLFSVDAAELPTELDKTRDFLGEHLPRTRSALDEGACGAAEGIVLRTADRSVIAKARFKDYDRTLKRRGGKR